MKAKEILEQQANNTILDSDIAIEIYGTQKKALTAIKNTQGLQEIKDYFFRKYDDAQVRFDNVDVNNVGEVASIRSDMKGAMEFLKFLKSMIE